MLCHPVPTSLCAQLAARVEAELVDNGHSVDRLDLYEAHFSPALTQSERIAYYGAPAAGSDVVPLQQRLLDAEHLVLVFPTWWFSLPAALKGWIDRVWSPGVAFSQGTPIRPLLTNLKSVTVVTTLGSPWWYDRIIMRQPVRHVLRHGLIRACAPKAQFVLYSFHSAENATTESVQRFTNRLVAAIRKAFPKP